MLESYSMMGTYRLKLVSQEHITFGHDDTHDTVKPHWATSHNFLHIQMYSKSQTVFHRCCVCVLYGNNYYFEKFPNEFNSTSTDKCASARASMNNIICCFHTQAHFQSILVRVWFIHFTHLLIFDLIEWVRAFAIRSRVSVPSSAQSMDSSFQSYIRNISQQLRIEIHTAQHSTSIHTCVQCVISERQFLLFSRIFAKKKETKTPINGKSSHTAMER